MEGCGVTEWQPIETAPRDGTRILMFYRGHQADSFLQGDDYLLVLRQVLVRKLPPAPIFEPFVANLVAAYLKFPHVRRHALDILVLVDMHSTVARS